jgi:hypothetical protein
VSSGTEEQAVARLAQSASEKSLSAQIGVAAKAEPRARFLATHDDRDPNADA